MHYSSRKLFTSHCGISLHLLAEIILLLLTWNKWNFLALFRKLHFILIQNESAQFCWKRGKYHCDNLIKLILKRSFWKGDVSSSGNLISLRCLRDIFNNFFTKRFKLSTCFMLVRWETQKLKAKINDFSNKSSRICLKAKGKLLLNKTFALKKKKNKKARKVKRTFLIPHNKSSPVNAMHYCVNFFTPIINLNFLLNLNQNFCY